MNSSTLEVACGPPGIGAKIQGNFSKQCRNYLHIHHYCCYIFEYGVVDLHIGTIRKINSTALEVACPPPGIRAKI
jgi:hypothetical protein